MSGNLAVGSLAPSGLPGVDGGGTAAVPRAAAEPDAAPAWDIAGASAQLGGSVRVLVVDDNPMNLTLMSALIESRGLVPVVAADGAEAVALACGLRFDLILMDLQMPILDGLGATSAIRRFEAHSSRAAVPVLAYSSAPPGANLLAAHGLNGSLNKPCELQELEDCLAQWCPAYRSLQAEFGVGQDSSNGLPPAACASSTGGGLSR
ncbi:response regulator [Ideonella sp. A 288]|uniref:response regulator n=1 Tax=Ideonella sp. A 288 TaxID=1962181 RepID=UPI001303C895|nr:response regulator [Ideonella sp. A 288]